MINNCYNFKELIEKYNWNTSSTTGLTVKERIRYAENRGVIIEEAFRDHRNIYFKILSEPEKTEWKVSPSAPQLEVSKNGKVRFVDTKRELGSLDNTTGYITVTSKFINYRVHRLVMEAFNPIEGMENYVVDHINGNRADNRLENLRWVLQRQNTKYRDDNWKEINIDLQALIQKKGYPFVLNLLRTALNEDNNSSGL